MKPSTYKKMKHMRDRMGKWFGLTIYYFLYPIVYLVRLIRERSDENLKKRSTPEYATSLVAKEIYEKLLRKKTSEDVVVIAEYVERNVGWDTPWSIFGFYLRNGKASKSYQFMKKEQKEMNDNQFMELVLKKFKEMNKYTFVTEYMDERAAKTSYIKGYEKKHQVWHPFGIVLSKIGKEGNIDSMNDRGQAKSLFFFCYEPYFYPIA